MSGPLAPLFAQVRDALASRVRGTDICQWCSSEGEQPHDPECALSVLSVIERHAQEMESALLGIAYGKWGELPGIEIASLMEQIAVEAVAALPAREEGADG